MRIVTDEISLKTKGDTDIIDITPGVADKLAKNNLKNGTVTIFVPGSTGGLSTIEYEPGVVKDLKEAFEKVAPSSDRYAHDEAWGDGNGHSHVRASLLGSSLTVPFKEGRLTLGTWQQIIFCDFDNRSRQRRLILQMIGE